MLATVCLKRRDSAGRTLGGRQAIPLACRGQSRFHTAAVAETCDWLADEYGPDWKEKFPVLASYPRELFDYAGEDRFPAANGLS